MSKARLDGARSTPGQWKVSLPSLRVDSTVELRAGTASTAPLLPRPSSRGRLPLPPPHPPVPLTSCSAFQLEENSSGLRGGPTAAVPGPLDAAAASPRAFLFFLLFLLFPGAAPLGAAACGSAGLCLAMRGSAG